MNKIFLLLFSLISVNVYANEKLLRECVNSAMSRIGDVSDEMLACNQIYGKPKLDLNNRVALRHIHWCFQNTVHGPKDDTDLMKCVKQLEE